MIGEETVAQPTPTTFLEEFHKEDTTLNLSKSFSSREPYNKFSDAFLRMLGVLLFCIVLLFTFEVRFFSIHPVLMSFTYGFLLLEGILVARFTFSHFLTKKDKFKVYLLKEQVSLNNIHTFNLFLYY
jgi:hypothetical protein